MIYLLRRHSGKKKEKFIYAAKGNIQFTESSWATSIDMRTKTDVFLNRAIKVFWAIEPIYKNPTTTVGAVVLYPPPPDLV